MENEWALWKIQRVGEEISSISKRICNCALVYPVARFQAQDIRLATDARCRCRCRCLGCWPGFNEFPHISVFVCRASCAQVSLRIADRRPQKKTTRYTQKKKKINLKKNNICSTINNSARKVNTTKESKHNQQQMKKKRKREKCSWKLHFLRIKTIFFPERYIIQEKQSLRKFRLSHKSVRNGKSDYIFETEMWNHCIQFEIMMSSEKSNEKFVELQEKFRYFQAWMRVCVRVCGVFFCVVSFVRLGCSVSVRYAKQFVCAISSEECPMCVCILRSQRYRGCVSHPGKSLPPSPSKLESGTESSAIFATLTQPPLAPSNVVVVVVVAGPAPKAAMCVYLQNTIYRPRILSMC